MSETQVTTEASVEVIDDLDAFSTDFFGQNKVESEPASPEVEQEKPDDVKVENEAQTDEPELDDEVPEEETPKPRKTFQDRINELVKQREDEKRASEAKLAELEKKWEAQLAALNPQATKKETAEPSPLDQNADGTDKYPLGEFDPAYVKDLTRYTLEQERTQMKIKEEQERQQQEQERAQQTLVASWNEKLAPAKERYPDLQEKGQELIDGFTGLDPNYAQYLTNLLMSMDAGPDVLYYLANNRDEAVKIVNSGAQKATLALGRIEAKFIEAEQQKQAAKPRVSKAPAPAPVQARGTGGGQVSIEPDTDDLDAFTKEFFRKKG